MIVVDASTLTDFLVGRKAALDAVQEALGADDQQPLHAPELDLALALGLDDPLLLTGDRGLASRAGVALGTDRVRLTR